MRRIQLLAALVLASRKESLVQNDKDLRAMRKFSLARE